jgi:hypothetical protein
LFRGGDKFHGKPERKYMADSIATASDAEILGIASNLLSTVETTPAVFGLSAAYVTSLETAKDFFTTALSNHIAKQAEAKAQTAAKDGGREELVALIRDARTLAKAAKVSDTNVASMGIPSQSQAAPANATVPSATVDTSERMRHKLSWRDAATPENKRKPRGTMGAEIYVKLGDTPPGNEKDCMFLTLDAFSPYVAEYDPVDAGKTAHYMLRWRLRDGSISAWGETVSATITG